jgi:hypothetical protein
MRTLTRHSSKQVGEALETQPHSINYQWATSDGTICHGRSVQTGRDQAHAERRFFSRNRHVQPETEEVAS